MYRGPDGSVLYLLKTHPEQRLLPLCLEWFRQTAETSESEFITWFGSTPDSTPGHVIKSAFVSEKKAEKRSWIFRPRCLYTSEQLYWVLLSGRGGHCCWQQSFLTPKHSVQYPSVLTPINTVVEIWRKFSLSKWQCWETNRCDHNPPPSP